MLRDRRARTLPHDVGLDDSKARRVPGLKRSEVAQLAGVSAEYYTRLEQGRCGHPSEFVLDALCRALRLSGEARAELMRVATTAGDSVRSAPQLPEVWVPSALRSDGPSLLVNRVADVVAWNGMAALLLANFGSLRPRDRNIARVTFLHAPEAGRRQNLDAVAGDTVSLLRETASRGGSTRALATLIGELVLGSDDFAFRWLVPDDDDAGMRLFRHPEVGELQLTGTRTAVPGRRSLRIVSYSALPGSNDADALRLLDTWISDDLTAGTGGTG